MSVLLETSVGDLVIDLDIDGSPSLSRNFLKLVKARYYTGVLIYNVQENRYCQLGDPKGDGTGGCSIYGLIDATLNDYSDVTTSSNRFIKATNSGAREITKEERKQKGIVTVVEIGGIADTIGSQILITLNSGPSMSLDNMSSSRFFSLGKVAEDGGFTHFDNKNNTDTESTLNKINCLYCDTVGRPYTDVRIKKALIVHDPYPDPYGMDQLMQKRGILFQTEKHTMQQKSTLEISNDVVSSPQRLKPLEEIVPERLSAQQLDQYDEYTSAEQHESLQQKEAKSRAVVLEMLGDLPSADVKTPENVLFVCKLNPVTQDEDLELIFARFDPNAKAEIIRDSETGQSLNYAFVEFSSKEQCTEAFLKMNNALVDDRRIKVDFSQSVSKEWNKYTQQIRIGAMKSGQLRGQANDDRYQEQSATFDRNKNNKGDPSFPSRRDAIATDLHGSRRKSKSHYENYPHENHYERRAKMHQKDRDHSDRRIRKHHNDIVKTHRRHDRADERSVSEDEIRKHRNKRKDNKKRRFRELSEKHHHKTDLERRRSHSRSSSNSRNDRRHRKKKTRERKKRHEKKRKY